MIPRPVPRRGLYALATVVAMAATALGLVGSGVASAHSGHHASASAPRTAADIPNLGLVELRIQAYYGDPNGTGVASPHSNYARQTDSIAARTRRYLQARLSQSGPGKPALVLDIDDTSLLTYGYEVSQGFGFTVASDDSYLETHTLPAVFGMPALANWAASHGITVFWITGRPVSQRALTRKNLAAVGYAPPANKGHLFLRPSNPPGYLTCGTSCTTSQYKSLTRKHIAAEGYDILADMGDQFSDLRGGFADRTVKLPNPMYFIP
jgi:HAD superfamily, subfamily IIIB (Acid phosphatase)